MGIISSFCFSHLGKPVWYCSARRISMDTGLACDWSVESQYGGFKLLNHGFV